MDRYFKYQSADAARPTLINGTLRWSRPSRFNDLFDMAVPFSTDFDTDYIVRRSLELMWERVAGPERRPPLNRMGEVLDANRAAFLTKGKETFLRDMRAGVEASVAKLPSLLDEFSEEVIHHLSSIKVLCLCKVKDDNGMWGLYGNNEGLVLELATIPELDSVYRLAKPIQYADRAPPMLTDDELAQLFAGDRKLHYSLANPLMYFKTTRWRDEQEWRLVSGDGRFPNQEVEDIPFHPRELVGVYFGARAAGLRAELEPVIRQKYPHAKLWQAVKGKAMNIDFLPIEEATKGS
ncbi:DUF2971 domain-containing protein [Stenotrophomonas rhizophila]|uniref:DUF2971 domain-containing protein n=1 Tax=Stenotrophomonas rhizophila TaxID=216778 RepID=UPI00117DEC07|nr:DUF2971 domain-containing protein [Stenotrophomonas rhizophila]